MSVRKAQKEINAAEFAEWVAYYSLDPFGEERADLRIAQLDAIIATVNAPKGRRFRPKDFMFDFTKHGRRMGQNEIAQQLMLFAKAHNEAIKRGGSGNPTR